MKVLWYGLCGLGLSFLVSVAVGKLIAAGNRRLPQYTVIWRNRATDSMLQSYNGTVTVLGDHVAVEGDRGPILVAKADIVELA